MAELTNTTYGLLAGLGTAESTMPFSRLSGLASLANSSPQNSSLLNFNSSPVWPAPVSTGNFSSLSALILESSANALTVPVSPTPASQWVFVTRRFDQLIDNIGIQQSEIDDGTMKLGRLLASLNRCYWLESSQTANYLLIGSWAKQTRVRPFSDIDVMFILPFEVYQRFQKRAGNKQSDLLQEMRTNLHGSTYPRTEIRGDRHVVVIEVDGVTIEVAPAFLLDDGRYWVCDAKGEGSYKLADPAAELQALLDADASSNGNARSLTRLLKKWQIHADVPLKAFQLERLALEFLSSWPYRAESRFWYDWMMRDFFAFLVGRAGGYVCMPGTGEWIALGSDWLAKARTAYLNAAVACIHEQANEQSLAGNSWREIFGCAVPVWVS